LLPNFREQGILLTLDRNFQIHLGEYRKSAESEIQSAQFAFIRVHAVRSHQILSFEQKLKWARFRRGAQVYQSQGFRIAQ
jgi:hypothetical protein